MNHLTAILLGILQGLTEFLPVSSSGHLVLAQYFFGIQPDNNTLLEVFLHLGTLAAILVYFRKMLWELLLSLLRLKKTVQNRVYRHNRTLISYLLLATLATGVLYYLAGERFEALFSRPLIVAFMLIITGVIVFVSDYVKNTAIPASEMGVVRSLIIGIIQGIAIIPGISRSGSTISAAIFTGVKREDAANFSFLLSIPAILGANLVSLKDFQELGRAQFWMYLSGALAAFLVAYLVIALMLQLIKQARLKYFAIYCWVLALLSIAFILWL